MPALPAVFECWDRCLPRAHCSPPMLVRRTQTGGGGGSGGEGSTTSRKRIDWQSGTELPYWYWPIASSMPGFACMRRPWESLGYRLLCSEAERFSMEGVHLSPSLSAAASSPATSGTHAAVHSSQPPSSAQLRRLAAMLRPISQDFIFETKQKGTGSTMLIFTAGAGTVLVVASA